MRMLLFACVVCAIAAAANTRAQPCTRDWISVTGVGGVAGMASSTFMWDPDGNGPVPARLVIGGSFGVVGREVTSCVAMWDGVEWHRLGEGVNRAARTFATLQSGELVVGGIFTTAGLSAACGVAMWDGQGWSPLPGLSAGADVRALAVDTSGTLYAGGVFTTSTGGANIARWNGVTWVALGAGADGPVNCLAASPSGGIIVGGAFSQVGAVPASNVARWSGAAWSSIASGLSSEVTAIAVRQDGEIWTGNAPGAVGAVSRFDGTLWLRVGSLTCSGTAYAECTVLSWGSGDELLVGGRFDAVDGVPSGDVARWNGTWSHVGSPVGDKVLSLSTLPDGSIVCAKAGEFDTLVKLTGQTWRRLGSGLNQSVYALAATSEGDIVAGGFFTDSGDVHLGHIARLEGSDWRPYGPGLRAEVYSIYPSAGGKLIAAGSNHLLGGSEAAAFWNGTSWSGYGPACSAGDLFAFAFLENGGVAAGGLIVLPGLGTRYLMVQAGAAWIPLQSPGWVRAYLPLSGTGGIIGGANFVATWDGSALGSVSYADGPVRALAVDSGGSVIVGGDFVFANGVMLNRIGRWTGSAWAPLGTGFNGSVRALAVLDNGDIVAGGGFTQAGGSAANYIARWDGAAWHPLGVGVDNTVRALLVRPNGDLAVGGSFTMAGGRAAGFYAVWGCSASAECYPNCDQSTAQPALNAQDFACFISKFSAGDPYANCDQSTASPSLNVLDFSCFVRRFAAGCT